jgi:hypothetical protein
MEADKDFDMADQGVHSENAIGARSATSMR